MSTAASILRSKHDAALYTVAPDATVFDAVRLMADKAIGALLVMDDGQVVGIVTERDYARKIALLARSSRETLVREIMTPRVLCVRPDQTSQQCMALMTENRFRHLPVMDGARPLGMVSIGDLVRDIIAEQGFIIEQLEHYIAGEPA